MKIKGLLKRIFNKYQKGKDLNKEITTLNGRTLRNPKASVFEVPKETSCQKSKVVNSINTMRVK